MNNPQIISNIICLIFCFFEKKENKQYNEIPPLPNLLILFKKIIINSISTAHFQAKTTLKGNKICILSKSDLPAAPLLKDHAKAPPNEQKAP